MSELKRDLSLTHTRLRFLVSNELGAIQFVLELNGGRTEFNAGQRYYALDLGYHSPTPVYEGQRKMPECDVFPEGCYYDGSTLQAEGLLNRYLATGNVNIVWSELESRHRKLFTPKEVETPNVSNNT